MTSASALADDQPRAPHALAGAVAGVLAAAVAIGAAQLAAGLTVPQSSPVLAVGQAAIDLTPPPVKDFAISAFGADDKTVLLGGILVVLALYAAVVGILAVRRLAFGMWGLALFAFIGLAAALTRPTPRRNTSCPPWPAPRPARSRWPGWPAAAGWLSPSRPGRVGAPPGLPRPARRPRPSPARPPRPAGGPDAAGPSRGARRPDAAGPSRAAGCAGCRPNPLRTPAYSFTYLPNPDDQGPSAGPRGGGSWSPAA